MPKRSLRSQMLSRRTALTAEAWAVSSRAAQSRLLELDEFRRAQCVALYAPTRHETDTTLVMTTAFALGKRVLYPAVCGQQMVFRRVERIDELQAGAFGILEPCPTGIDHQADEPDLIVVPGVAFDRCGHRIGYGKGFYDRFLQHPGRTAHLIGFCHDFQLIDSTIPADDHDIRMEIIVTDLQVIRCGSNRSCTGSPD